MPYKIRDWSANFEVAQSRRPQRTSWVAVPNDLNSTGYCRLMRHKNGLAHFGLWVALLEMVSAMPKDRRDGSIEYSTEDIADKVRGQNSIVTEGLARLVEVGWLEAIAPSALLARSEHAPSTVGATGQDRTGQDKEGATAPCVAEAPPLELSGAPAAPQTATISNVAEIFARYKHHHPRAKCGIKEHGLIRARLKDGYSIDDLRRAIDGCHKSPHHCGENERGKKYQKLALIMRDSSQVQDFIEVASGEGLTEPKRNGGYESASEANARLREKYRREGAL